MAMTDSFTMPVRIMIRPCVEADLPNLEWFGMFTEHREIIRQAFGRQAAGETAMLVAEANGFPIGQVWIDYARKPEEGCALLWAMRVMPPFQRTGIGARLVGAAERDIRRRAVRWAEVGVERHNAEARRFYERLGYRLIGTMSDSYSYTTPDGVRMTVPLDEWVFRKEVGTQPR